MEAEPRRGPSLPSWHFSFPVPSPRYRDSSIHALPYLPYTSHVMSITQYMLIVGYPWRRTWYLGWCLVACSVGSGWRHEPAVWYTRSVGASRPPHLGGPSFQDTYLFFSFSVQLTPSPPTYRTHRFFFFISLSHAKLFISLRRVAPPNSARFLGPSLNPHDPRSTHTPTVSRPLPTVTRFVSHTHTLSL